MHRTPGRAAGRSKRYVNIGSHDESHLNPTLLAVEHFVDRAIPCLVLLIAILLALEFSIDLHVYEPWPTVADTIVVTFFVVDLAFKWHRTKLLKDFFRRYWLDVLAVFPFYLLFRVYVEAAELLATGERVAITQKVAHEALLLKEAKLLEEARLIELGEKAAKEERVVARGIRFGQRLIRGWKGAHEEMMLVSAKHRRSHRKK